MKYLITGLGNPGAEYHYNRHNIGFRVLNFLAQQKEKDFESDKLGYTVTVKFKGRQLVLLKPTTYMNLSGKAVRYHLTKNKIQVSNLLVITDDIALPFGKLRLRAKGGAGGHNGLQDIEDVLGNTQYARLRFGVGGDFPKGTQVDYVLGDFPEEQESQLEKLMEKSINIVQDFARNGINRAMNFNND